MIRSNLSVGLADRHCADAAGRLADGSLARGIPVAEILRSLRHPLTLVGGRCGPRIWAFPLRPIGGEGKVTKSFLPAAAAAIEQAAEAAAPRRTRRLSDRNRLRPRRRRHLFPGDGEDLRRQKDARRSIRSSLMSAVLRRRNARRGCRRRLSGSRAAFGQARSPLSRQPVELGTVCDLARAGLASIALRIPAHPTARALHRRIRKTDCRALGEFVGDASVPSPRGMCSTISGGKIAMIFW